MFVHDCFGRFGDDLGLGIDFAPSSGPGAALVLPPVEESDLDFVVDSSDSVEVDSFVDSDDSDNSGVDLDSSADPDNVDFDSSCL